MWMDSLTTADGKTFDLVKILALAAVGAFVVFSGYDLMWLKHAFDPQAYGIGLGAVFLGTAGALNLKKDTEPKAPEEGV